MTYFLFYVMLHSMTINKFLKETSGRFTTLQIKNTKTSTVYCAKIVKVTPKTIVFSDVNDPMTLKRVNKTSVRGGRSGSAVFG